MEVVPESLVTDAQAAKMERVMEKIHIAAKNDVDLSNQVVGDLVKYKEGTKFARKQLKWEAKEWKHEAKDVAKSYKHAWKFDMEQIHYDPVRPGHPGSIEFTNTDQVVQNWRNAIQEDQDLGDEIVNDLKSYK